METVKNAEKQYEENLRKIKEYKEVKENISDDKKEKIQPAIDELKKQNKALYGSLEDLYIFVAMKN